MSQTNHPACPRKDAGFTILEMVIASVALLMLSMMVTQLLISGQAAHRYSTRIGKLTDVTHGVSDDLKAELRAAVRIFSNDAVGNRYLGVLAPWTGFEPIAGSRLPTVTPAGDFEKDTSGNEKTGNQLLFARHAWSDAFVCTSGNSYRVDIYRLEHYFLRREGVTASNPGTLNLGKWTSEPLANGSQIDLITNTDDLMEFLIHLDSSSADSSGDVHDQVNVVWQFGEDPAVVGTFRQIRPDGTLTTTPESPREVTWRIEAAPTRCEPTHFYPNLHTVSTNDSPNQHGLSRFGIRDDSAGSGEGFPHGLEFQVIGPTSARKILFHLSTSTTNNDGLRAYFESQAILNIREG